MFSFLVLVYLLSLQENSCRTAAGLQFYFSGLLVHYRSVILGAFVNDHVCKIHLGTVEKSKLAGARISA